MIRLPKNSPARDIVRVARLSACVDGDLPAAAALAESTYGPTSNAACILRSASSAGSLSPANDWGAVALSAFGNGAAAFFGAAHEASIIGRIGSIRKVPTEVRAVAQSARAAAFWVGDAGAIPATKISFAPGDEMEATKLAAICVVSKELARSSRPGAEDLVATIMLQSVVDEMDRSFVDPSVAAIPEIRPGSITAEVEPISASGSTINDFRVDFQIALAAFAGNLEESYILMPSRLAVSLASTGNAAFQNLSAVGIGELFGLPCIASGNAALTSSYGSPPVDASAIILVDGSAIALADNGGEIDTSTAATVEIDDAPLANAASKQISLWQSGLVGIKTLRFVSWKLTRLGAVSWISGAQYGA